MRCKLSGIAAYLSTCSHCGQLWAPDRAICPTCGTRDAATSPPDPAVPYTLTENDRRFLRRKLIDPEILEVR